MAALRCASMFLKEISQKSLKTCSIAMPMIHCRQMSAFAETRKALLSMDILTVNIPSEHNYADLAKLYRISIKDMKAIFAHGFPTRAGNRLKDFVDFHMIVRKPVLQALETIRSMKDGDRPPRIAFYGDDGTGKSIALSHVILYCAYANWLILHVPAVHHITFSKENTEPSAWREGRLDQPEEATEWLKAFKTVNFNLIEEIQTSKDYVWGRQETIPKGSSITKVVDTGMSRSNFASDAVGIILKEVTKNDKFKVLYAVDAFNRLFTVSSIVNKDNEKVNPQDLSLVRHFTRVLEPENSIRSGCYAVALSRTGVYGKYIQSFNVEDQIGKMGMAKLGDHIPIEVGSFSATELHNYLLLLQHTNKLHKEIDERLEQEITFLTDRNPSDIQRLIKGH